MEEHVQMKDAECPYCGAEIDINHDDGYGYQEGVTHQQQCGKCDKTFVYETSKSFYYDTAKADCLNGSDHDYKPMRTFPVEFTRMECQTCGDRRDLTKIKK